MRGLTSRITYEDILMGLTLFWLSVGATPICAQSGLWTANVENLADCPVKVLSAKVGGTSAEWRVGDVVLYNESTAEVKRVVVRYVFKYSDGRVRRGHRLFPPYKAGEFQAGQRVERKTIPFRGSGTEALPIVEAVAQMYHVDFYDGRSCGGDEDGFLAEHLAENALLAAEKRRLLSLYERKGEEALVEAVLAEPAHDEHHTVAAFRQMFLRRYQRKGLEGLLELLREP